MIFKVGDKVKIVDEQSEGEIVRIEKDRIWVATGCGFDFPYMAHQIIKISKSGEKVYSPKEYKGSDEVRYTSSKSREWSFPKIHLHTKSVPEIDLHIEELTNIPLESHEHIHYQLGFFKKIMNQAKSQKVRRLIIIHGVGTGVLRSSLQSILEECYPEAECFDADYSKYGYGAMEIILRNLHI